MNQSDVVTNGQTINVRSGSGAINEGDLIQLGGPGNEAWSVVTADNAAIAAIYPTAANTNTPIEIVGGAVNNYARWGSATDILGNIYVLSPNSSSQGVDVTKYSPANVSLISATVLDSTAHAMIGNRILALSNGTYAAAYVDSTTGGVRFTIFDAYLNIVAGPTAVVTGYETGSVAYIDACTLSGGGFAVVYQNSGHSAIYLQTYTNAGAAVLAAASVQVLTGTALAYVRLAQLSNGNLVIAIRYTGTPAGTSFVIVTTSGVSVVTNTIVDSTSTAGFCELSVMSAGYFAIADANGTNLQAAVFNNAGVQQGSNYTGATTLNNTTYIQLKLTNDGLNFYLFFTLTSGGLKIVQLTDAGANSITSGTILTGTFTTTTSLDAVICNNTATIIAASTSSGGQHFMTVGLPDSYLGIEYPYTIIGAETFGNSATTGSYWPSLHALGDFTVSAVYDQQNSAAMYIGLIKFANSAIQGIAQASIAAGNPGTLLTINPGPGSYPTNVILGTPATSFNHAQTTPPGNSGVLFQNGVSLSDPAILSGCSSPTTLIYAGTADTIYTAPSAVQITLICTGTGGTSEITVNGVLVYTYAAGNIIATFSFAIGAGQVLTVNAVNSASYILSASKIN